MQRWSLLRLLRHSKSLTECGPSPAIVQVAMPFCCSGVPVVASSSHGEASFSLPSTSGRAWFEGGTTFAAWRGMAKYAQAAAEPHAVRLNALRDAPGATAEAKRWGRGDGGGRGAYCGRGVKGQKARKGNGKPGILFDGGQKGLKKLPKVQATPSNPVVYARVNLGTIMDWVKAGRLDASEVITMQDLRNSGAVAKRILWGVKLLGLGSEQVDRPLHLQVSAVSEQARQAVEAAGGSVTTVYYNRLGLRALLKPEAFEKKGRALPSPPRAWAPRDNGKFDVIGQLPPMRNIPAIPALPGAFGGGSSVAAAAGGL